MKKKDINNYIENSANVILTLKDQTSDIIKISNIIFKKISNNNKILIAGNGGSSSDGQHFGGELTSTFSKFRRPFTAINLSDNQSALTAWSNDYNYETFFERQVEAFGQNGDILFLISTSGGNAKNRSSINLVKACNKAKSLGLKTICLLGKTGGLLKKKCDHSITIKSDTTSIIQESHIVVIHLICMYIDYFLTNK